MSHQLLGTRCVWAILPALFALTASAQQGDAPPRARRVLYNFDGDSCLSTRAHGTGPVAVDPTDVRQLIEEVAYEGSQVDTVLVCVNAQVMYYPTQVGTMRGSLSTDQERANWPASEKQRFQNLAALFGAGIDPYALMLAESKRRGREALLSFRMNDDHGNDFLRTQFWDDHPEYRLGRGALDFGHEAVRDYVARLIEEAVRRYDSDGIELDFNRFPAFFRDDPLDQRVAKMNSLVERVRGTLDDVSRQRGRPLVLAVRVPSNFGRTPPTPETARSLGCDVAAWVRRGWVDFVTVSEFLYERGDLPIGWWKQALPTVPVYGGIECTKGGRRKNLSADEYRRAAALLIESHADGVYLFNFFTSRENGADSYEPPYDVLRGLVRLPRGRGGDATAPDAAANAEVASIEADFGQIHQRLAALRPQPDMNLDSRSLDAWADAQIFVKAARWALDFEPSLDENERQLVRGALRRATERADALAAGRTPWTRMQGKSIRGFVSAVDGSTQPYGLVVPAGHDPEQPTRLDVVLHGSRRATGLGDLLFINDYDTGDGTRADVSTGAPTGQAAPGKNYLELHPMGRLGENAYRFEGETDIDEAIEAVCRRYRVDRRRIVLRGSSLGGVGAWQLGLKRPDRYVAIGPTAGPVDTIQFAGSPWPHFVPLDPLTAWQQTTLHMVDAIDYATNVGMVPVVAAMGDQDPYFPTQAEMERACEREGVSMVGLVDRGAGHGISAAVSREQLRLLGTHADAPIEPLRGQVHFVTWTLKFNRCHWIELLRLDQHYKRAEIDARIEENGAIRVREPRNVSRFAIHAPAFASASETTTVTIGETVLSVPGGKRRASAAGAAVFARRSSTWEYEGEASERRLDGKRPGLQGPIDDAFATPFLCVRGTGTPWNLRVGQWADASLRRFAHEWRRHYRGDLRIKNDTDVTDDDLRKFHLILFGDPGSNAWIGRIADKLPIEWTRDSLRAGSQRFSSDAHGPQLIFPNPLPEGTGHYVVLNSGHTYHAPELRFSYMVFPRLGDWAITRVGDNPDDSTLPVVAETILQSGFFDEDWGMDTVDR